MTTTTLHKPVRSASLLTPLIEWPAASNARAVIFLALFALVTFLPGFFQIPPIDRDEARFAQATKQMLETHEFVDIRFQEEVRYKKPVGIYWLQAAAVEAGAILGIPDARERIWLYRIPSLFGALGAVLLTFWAALAFVPRRAAILAGVMMASCILLGVEARLAKTDAVLLFTCVAAMGAMARLYLADRSGIGPPQPRWTEPAIFWTAMAAGILIKGPLIVMFTALTALALIVADRSARWLKLLRPIPGIVWMLALVLPWFIAILVKSGGSFLQDSVGNDMLAKVASSQEAHGAPPGTYFVLFWATFWPSSILAGLAAPYVWRARREPEVRFLLAWLIPSWLVFEIVVTKLPHYVLPLYPAIAILIARAIAQEELSVRPWLVHGAVWWFVVPLLLTGLGIGASIAISREPGLLVWPLAAATVVIGFFAWRSYRSEGAPRALLRVGMASVLLYATLYGVVIPSMTKAFPAPILARVLQDSGCSDPQAASVGYQEPSLVFLAGTKTLLTDANGAADFLAPGGCRFAFVDSRFESTFLQHAGAIGLQYTLGPRFDAINISGGRKITIAVYRAGKTP